MNETINQTINNTVNATVEVVKNTSGKGGADGFLNFIIPVILLIIALAFIYSKFGEQLKTFFAWVKNLFADTNDRFQNTVRTKKELFYE